MRMLQRGSRKNLQHELQQLRRDYFRPESPPLDAPKMHHDQEKRLRREVANSNERRRMQSINAGFQSLRDLIPNGDGEKLSKAAILQQTVGYIAALESEKTRLMTVNQHLHQMLKEHSQSESETSPPPKRKKSDTESSDEGISMSTEPEDPQELRREMLALRKALDHERSQRLLLEQQKSQLEQQIYPSNIRQAASEIQAERYKEAENARYMEEQRLQEMEEKQQSSSESSSWKESPPTAPLSTSASSRNMEILLEAFRVIEGDRSLFSSKDSSNIPCKEETLSDEEMHSAEESGTSSGRDSPLSCRLSDSDVAQVPDSVVLKSEAVSVPLIQPYYLLPHHLPHPMMSVPQHYFTQKQES